MFKLKKNRNAFSGCRSLLSITFSENLTKIGSNAFSNCYKLVELYNFSDISITAGDTNSTKNGGIGKNLLKVHDTQEESCIKTINGINYFVDADKKIVLSSDNKDLTNYVLENDATEIWTYAFSNDTNLNTINISNSITKIGIEAFSDCSNLIEVKFNEGLTILGDSVFENCSNLQTIEIPSSVTEIGTSAFANCTNLSEVILNDGLTTLKGGVFSRCSALKKLSLPSTLTNCLSTSLTGINNLEEIKVNSKEAYKTALSSMFLRNCLEGFKIYVLKSVDDGSNGFIVEETFTKSTDDSEYNIYTYNVAS